MAHMNKRSAIKVITALVTLSAVALGSAACDPGTDTSGSGGGCGEEHSDGGGSGSGANAPWCVSDTECDDGNECTVNRCKNAMCVFYDDGQGGACAGGRGQCIDGDCIISQ